MKLLEKTLSVCPKCLETIPARIVEKKGAVLLVKKCGKHGEFEDTYWSDYSEYVRVKKYEARGEGIENPCKQENGCPKDCGICENHETGTLLAIIDITNQCNQNCPICFAKAGTGKKYEPSKKQVKKILSDLKKQKPKPVDAVMFSGGEPTLRKELPDFISYAKKKGFPWILVATNGKLLAKDPKLAQRIKKAGTTMIYLQFDGLSPKTNKTLRGYDCLKEKKKALKNCRLAGLYVCLVPTIIKGVNEGELGKIIEFMIKRQEYVKAVNFQPVSLTGRLDKKTLKKKRITIPDISRLVEKQSKGKIRQKDWLPIPSMESILQLMRNLYGPVAQTFSTHPHCGAGVYLFGKDESYVTLNSFMDIEKARQIMEKNTNASEAKKGIGKMKLISSTIKRLSETLDTEKKPDYLNWKNFFRPWIWGTIRGKQYKAWEAVEKNACFVGSMHFQDKYNLDLKRLKKCCIHYATTDGRLIPFCAYNNFPWFREEIEKKH